MVIYEYECEECGERFQIECRYGEPDPCPEFCPSGHRQVRRVFSPPRIFFKGSGFYVNDSGRSSKSSTSK
ncbi:MAG: zinc ribbon domain-containing protein [Chloroflexi bacterium]|nr:zinc ribbon domain-containing protein [Chloroflexota bacterium]